MDWKDVPLEEAQQNKYYGLGGWLLVLYVFAVIAFLAAFLNLANVDEFKHLYGDAYGIMLVVSILQGLLLLPFIILAPKKSSLMPKATISAYWFSIALTAISGITTNHYTMLPQLLVGVIFVALFSWYLRKSKRVNVTYLNRVAVEAKTAPETPNE